MESKNTTYLDRLGHLPFYAPVMALRYHVGLGVVDRSLPHDRVAGPVTPESIVGPAL